MWKRWKRKQFTEDKWVRVVCACGVFVGGGIGMGVCSDCTAKGNVTFAVVLQCALPGRKKSRNRGGGGGGGGGVI